MMELDLNLIAIQGIHFGLRDIRERADSISAVLKLSSVFGKGTTLELEWKGKDLHQDEGC